MTERVLLQPAFVLHARPFRETSLLVDLLTRDFGRLGAIARGARSQQSRYRGHLRSFVPILISWSGKSELVSLNQLESSGSPILLEKNSLLAGLYINELIVRLLHQHDSHPEIFDDYHASLLALQKNQEIEPILRRFEKNLLVELGFGFSWAQTADTLNSIVATQWYAFQPDLGFCENLQNFNHQTVFSGAHLLAIAENKYDNLDILRTAKQIMRMTMQVRLGSKVIKSRELFI
ncbi:MAG: DNA repair protein RecO [Gammaproteobacteria bacterium]|nr:DNA repair protein RecO [Gammaproteobacteria bacterium]